MRIERSICPLTMLVERSMLTMRIERSICPLTMLVVEHAYNAYREEHLSAYKMDVRDYFGSQKTLVFSGKAQPVTVLDSLSISGF